VDLAIGNVKGTVMPIRRLRVAVIQHVHPAARAYAQFLAARDEELQLR